MSEPVKFTTLGDRSLKQYEPITSTSGDTVEVYESSAAGAPYLWMTVNGKASAHLRAEDAERLVETLKAALANHYQLAAAAQEEGR